MLRITASKNANGAIKYFEQGLSKEDYYLDGKEVAGTWYGKTAEQLGLTGTVDKEDFKQLVHNRTPDGKKLTPRDRANRRPGYDFTFNAPKSVSVVYAITKDKEILKAHRQAVITAMNSVEQNVQTQKGQGKNKHYETTGNMAMAMFDHFSARPVKKQSKGKELILPDPHLHSHCFVLNATRNDEKNRYQAVELGTVKKEAPYYEALYHAAFVKNLKKAGYQIERTNNRWEIKGINREMINKFSNRSIEINKTIKEKRLTWEADKSKVGAKTRLKKNNTISQKDLDQQWRERLTKQELSAILNAKSITTKNGDSNSRVPSIKAKDAIDKSMKHFFERKSVVSEKRVLGHAIASGYGDLSYEDIKKEWAKRNDIIRVQKNGANIITTKAMLKQEDRLIEFASSTKGKFTSIHTNYKIKRDYLNEQQQDAINHILTSCDQVMIVAGGAGTGKTSLLQEVRDAHIEKEHKLFAFAPSADASRGVLQEKGFKGANTIANLLSNTENHEQYKNQTLLIDEAGMVSLKDMNSIFGIAQKQNSRVILSGDWKQHHAVQAGDALRLLDERANVPIARVNEIVRQRHNKAYKLAIKDLSQGETLKGFERLDKMGAVKEIEDKEKRHLKIADAYYQSLENKRSAIVVSPTHKEGRDITSTIREKLRAKGRIGKEEHQYNVQRTLHWTNSQKQDFRNYTKGMVVQFHQNASGIKAGRKYEVRNIEESGQVMIAEKGTQALTPLPLQAFERFQTYTQEHTHISKGDLIRITRNGYAVDGSRLNNGQVFTVNGIDKNGNIVLPNGKILSKEYQNFTLGYYRTSHSSQGKDAQDVFLVQSTQSFSASNDKQFYVSTSRGEQRCFIYTDDKKGLREAVQQCSDRMSAKELVEEKDRQSYEKMVKTQYYKKIDSTHEKGGIEQKGQQHRSPKNTMDGQKERTPG